MRSILPSLAVLLTSAGVVGFELALLRCLAVAQWHHFAYLVISTALLGFGGSGVVLTYGARPLLKHFRTVSAALCAAFAIAAPLCYRGAQALPLDPEYVLYSVEQVGLMIAYHLLLLLPFLIAATSIGLAIIRFGRTVHRLYGANLIGSGVGGAAMLLLMYRLAERDLLYAAGALGVAASLVWIHAEDETEGSRIARATSSRHARWSLRDTRSARWAIVGTCAAALVVAAVFRSTRNDVDPHKPLAQMQRLESQGDAIHLATRFSPRARLDAYSSSLLHDTLFAGFTATTAPPPQIVLYADGYPLGTVFEISETADAEILDHTLMSVPYRLLERPSVLLLGESGGTNIWLASRWHANPVDVVQPDPNVLDLLTGDLSDRGGAVFTLPGVTATVADPRLYVEASAARYDLIQLVQAEGFSVGTTNLRSIHEDYLLTREGLAACLRRLTDRGFLVLTRQQQYPPRDNTKFLTTVASALESLGVANPGQHVIQLRNYLAVITLASRTPLGQATCDRIRTIADQLRLDIEWLPCPGFVPRQTYAQILGPAGAPYSYYHYAAALIFSPEREAFIDEWVYDIRPALDDRPYFFDFFRIATIPVLKASYGRLWIRQLELGHVVVFVVLLEVLVVGGVLIILPLLWLKRRVRCGGTLPTGIYFFLLGLAYMVLEMLIIVRCTQVLGDPILSVGAVVSVFLIASGLGSLTSLRLFRDPIRRIRIAVIAILVLGSLCASLMPSVFHLTASWSTSWRFLVALLFIFPLAFAMGIPFPTGLSLIERTRKPLIPWAWGINGFASVAGPPAGVLLAVSVGIRVSIFAAIALYGLAAIAAYGLSQAHPENPPTLDPHSPTAGL